MPSSNVLILPNMQELLLQLESKTKKMVQRVHRLEMENKELRETVFSYLEQIEAQKKELEMVKSETQNRVIAQHAQHNNKALTQEIDKYLNLIDKSIASIKVSGL